VERFRAIALQDGPQRIETLDIEADAWMRVPGMPRLPVRLRMAHRVGRAFVHEIRAGRGPLSLRVGVDAYIDGRGYMKVGRAVHAGPTYDQGALIALWGEELAFPTAWESHPDVHWEPVDDATAHFVVRGPEGPITSLVRFGAGSWCPELFAVDRYNGDGPKVRWRVASTDWRRWPGGVLAPRRFRVRWADEPQPWLAMNVRALRVNSPVDDAFRLAAGSLGLASELSEPLRPSLRR
jgi:hypothetical protein